MSFVLYDLAFLFVFIILLALFLIPRRKKLKIEGVLILYRTKIGIRIIDYISKRYKKFLNNFEYVLIFIGYGLMLGMIYLLVQLFLLIARNPKIFELIKIPPIAPLIPYLPQIFNADYLPPFYFTYWIVVLGITAIFHEFMHGIFAKARGIKIKSTGFAFLGPFTAAFVEPDEEKVKKIKRRSQIAFLSAGSFANLILTILFFIVLWAFFHLAFMSSGVIFNTYTFSVLNTSQITLSNQSINVNFDGGLNLTKIYFNNTVYYAETDKLANSSMIIAYENTPALKAGLAGVITGVDGQKVGDNSDLKKILDKKNPGDNITVETLYNNSVQEYGIELTERPDNKSQAYLGIATINTESSSLLGKVRNKILFFKDPNTYYKPRGADELIIFIYNLFWWLILINLSVALSNMLPVGIFDGGRVFYLTILSITKSEKTAKIAFGISTYLILGIFVLLTILWFFSLF